MALPWKVLDRSPLPPGKFLSCASAALGIF